MGNVNINSKKTLKIVGTTVIGLFLLLFIFIGSHIIKPGYVGIVYSLNGGVENSVLSQGYKFKLPFFKKVTQYPISTQQAYLSADSKEGSLDNESFNIPTSGGKTVNVDLEFSYRFDSDKLTNTYQRFQGQSGKTIEQTFIRGKIKAWAGEVSGKFDIFDIYGAKRADLNSEVLNHVKQNFDEYGIVIESVNFTRIGLDADTEKAVQEKLTATQERDRAKIDAEKAAIEAQQKVDVAKKEAEALAISSQAEADANNRISTSLTPSLIEKIKYDKWDGKMPQVSGASSPIVDIRGNTEN
ncbi:MAG: prohibitin family protein [Clostridium sp.]